MNQRTDRTNFEDAPVSGFHRRVLFGGSLGQFTDGYVLGIIGVGMSLPPQRSD